MEGSRFFLFFWFFLFFLDDGGFGMSALLVIVSSRFLEFPFCCLDDFLDDFFVSLFDGCLVEPPMEPSMGSSMDPSMFLVKDSDVLLPKSK